MKRTSAPAIYKANGAVQRRDVALTEEVASALVRRVFSGKTLFPKEGYLALPVEGENGQEALINLSCNTLNAWVKRENVLPNGHTLRSVLDKAREEYRTIKEAEIDKKRREIIDAKFNRAISIRTREPVMGLSGPVVDKETGKPMTRENVKMFAEQMKNVRWLAERLDPERYGKVKRGEPRKLVFSLADLRRAKEQRDAGIRAQTEGGD